MNDIPEQFRGDSRMDIFWNGTDHPQKAAHFYSLELDLHHPDAVPHLVEETLSTEPAANLEARIDHISEEAVHLIQTWLSLRPQKLRKITRQEILNLLDRGKIDWEQEK